MIRALFRRLMVSNEEYQARHRLQQDKRRYAVIRQERRAIHARDQELLKYELAAMFDVEDSESRLAAITNPAMADNEEMREA